MKIVKNINEWKENFRDPVITIGNFDGVHQGHQELLKQLKNEARKRNTEAVIFTFDPHPLEVLSPEKCLPRLQTQIQKTEFFRELGIDGLIAFPFTKVFSRKTASYFIGEILVKELKFSAILVGKAFKFGSEREGDIDLLRRLGEKYGFKVIPFKEKLIDGEIISSTKIRRAIIAGDMNTAARFLGRPYAVEGLVVDGIKMGKKIGFPTANIQVRNQLLPTNGVYAVYCIVHGNRFDGAANIGIRPTIDTGEAIDKRRRVLEVHLLDFHEEIYNTSVQIFFRSMIRPEKRFASIPLLVRQMERDVAACRAYFLEESKK